MSISRGRISHTLRDDFVSLKSAVFGTLQDEKTIVEFEKNFAKYVDREHCHAYPFARTALYFTLLQLNLPQKSVVLMPSIMIKAFIDVVLDLGLTPEFVDSDIESGFANLEHLETKLKEKPSVYVMTYLFGIVPDLSEVKNLLSMYPTFVIEDFSQCLNGEYSDIRVGKIGNVALYSSSAVKTVDTYGGGMLFHDSGELSKYHAYQIQKLKNPSRLFLFSKILNSLIKNLATRRLVFSLFTFPFLRLVQTLGSDKYDRFVGNRSNSPIDSLPSEWFQRYTSVQAALGLRRLSKVKEMDKSRMEIGETFSKLGLDFPSLKSEKPARSVYWQYIVYPRDFKRFQRHLARHGIDCSQSSLINLSNLENYGWSNESFTAKSLYEQAVYIPCYADLSEKELSKISAALVDYKEL